MISPAPGSAIHPNARMSSKRFGHLSDIHGRLSQLPGGRERIVNEFEGRRSREA